MGTPAPNSGSPGGLAPPENSKDRANHLSEPPDRNDGSAGGVALPKKPEQTGRANSPSEPLPERQKKLPHQIPSWVQQGERHFITINCKQRNSDELLLNDTAMHLLASARHYEQIGCWHLWLMVVMPNHLHFIATFNLSHGIKKTISAWKRYQATTLKIEWQSDFFEHRLRNQSELDEKAFYIRMNPVRKNLVTTPEDWPYVLDRISIDGGSPGGLAPPDNSKCIGRANSPSEPQRKEPHV